MAGDYTWLLQDSKTTYTSPAGDLGTIDSQSLPFLFLCSMPRRPNRVSKQMRLVAQMLSTVLVEHFCVKEPERRRGHCPLASLARTSALSQTSLFRAPASWHESPDLSRQVCPCDLDSSACTRALRLWTSNAPTPSPIPTRGPLPRGSRMRTWSGWWARCSALPAPLARQLPFDKQRQPSTWPRLIARPRPWPRPAPGPAHRSVLACREFQRCCNHLDLESTTALSLGRLCSV